MVTNSKRREVARHLRRFAELGAWSEFETWAGAVGPGRVAELIEPEPERICHNVGGDDWAFRCSECGGYTTEFDHMFPPPDVQDDTRRRLREALGLPDDTRIGSMHSSVPRYCPWCGARVSR